MPRGRPICALLAILLAACGGRHAPVDEDGGVDGDVELGDSSPPGDADPPDDAAPRPDGDVAIDPDADLPLPPACAEVAAESHSCVTLASDGLYLMGLETGLRCRLFETSMPRLHGVSIARAGAEAFVCGRDSDVGDTHLYRISLLDGAQEELHASHGCEAVAPYDGGLLVMPDHADPEMLDRLIFYPTWADATSGAARLFTLRYSGSRMTAQGERLFVSGHAPDEVDRYSLPGGSPLGTIRLEGYDDWVNDWSATTDGLLVLINGHGRDGGTVVFDAETGARLWQLGATGEGLDCSVN